MAAAASVSGTPAENRLIFNMTSGQDRMRSAYSGSLTTSAICFLMTERQALSNSLACKRCAWLKMPQTLDVPCWGRSMNPKRVYGSCTLMGIIVVYRVYDPNFKVHLPKVLSSSHSRISHQSCNLVTSYLWLTASRPCVFNSSALPLFAISPTLCSIRCFTPVRSSV